MAARFSRGAPVAGLSPGLRRAGFRRVTHRGRRFQTQYFLVFRLDRADGGSARLGITVTRKVGKAVRRNRIKRLVREWFRAKRHELEAQDLVVIARRDIPSRLDLAMVGSDLDRALDSAECSPPC